MWKRIVFIMLAKALQLAYISRLADLSEIHKPAAVVVSGKWDETTETCKLNTITGATSQSGVDSVHTVVSSCRVSVVVDPS